jgi:lipopolysaccharide export system permease protein
MLPLIWKSIVKNYLKTFFLSSAVFASILVLVRVYEIARFATLGGGVIKIILFTLLQFPFILPLSIPLSAMIASIAIMQKMCVSSELTSLRSFGFSILQIIKPILVLSCAFSILNGYLVFAITPSIKQACKNLIIKVTLDNPLTLIQSGKMNEIKKGFLNYKIKRPKGRLEELFFVQKNEENRLLLYQIDQLSIENRQILAKNVNSISYTKKESKLPIAFVEHYHFILQPSELIPQLLFKPKNETVVIQRLNLKSLIDVAKNPSIKKKKRNEAKYEISRRAYLVFGPIILTWLGLCFSIDIGRRSSKYYKFLLFLSICCYFLVYLASKGLKAHFFLLNGLLCFTLVFLWFWGKLHLKTVELGKESWI